LAQGANAVFPRRVSKFAPPQSTMAGPGALPCTTGPCDLEANSSVNHAASTKAATTPSKTRGKHVTRFGATMELVVTQLGTGILLLPYLFSQAGVVPSMVGLMLIGAVASNRAALFAECFDIAGTSGLKEASSFVAIARTALGSWGEFAVSASISGTCYSAGIAFLILFGQLLSSVITFPGLPSFMAAICWKVMAATFLLATAFMNLSELQWMGVLGTMATMVVAAAIIVTAVGADIGHGAGGGVHSVNWTAPSLSVLLGSITSFCYSYGAVLTLPAIAQDMEDREKDLKPAVHYAHVLSTVVYLLIGLIAYMSFGNTVQPDVLDGLKTHSKPLWYIGVGGILVHVVMVVPFFIQVSVAFVEERLPASWWTPTASRVGLVLLLLVLACAPIEYFADFVGIVPATLVTLNCFVWPTVMYWGLMAKAHGSLRGAVLNQPWKFIWGVLIVAVAVMAMVLGTKAGIEHLIENMRKGGQ